MTLQRAADALKERKDAVDAQFRARLSSWRGRRVMILYDLTNVHLEGQGKGNGKDKRGQGKAKRSDCRLVTLAVGVGEIGFNVGTRLLESCSLEPST
ncbi:MAG: transposase, partial [Deltaproteobacteria bacterium]|nr:transposase [Deltaproteobacteria bacterium]